MPTNTYTPDSGLDEVAARVGLLVGAAKGGNGNGNGNMLDIMSAQVQDVAKDVVK